MTRLGEAVRGPARHLHHQHILVTLLLVLVTRSITTRAFKMTTKAHFPYDFWDDEERPTVTLPTSTTPTPTTTQGSNTSSYDYYYEKDVDFGSDPSTWKLLPIQIPDDLVSNAVLQKEVVKSSSVQAYMTPPTPQYDQHPGVTQAQFTLPPERLHSFNNDRERDHQIDHERDHMKDHGSAVPMNHNQDHHSTGTPKPQQRYESHSMEGHHSNLESYHQNWDRLDTGTNHTSSVPVRDNWDRHDTGNTHSNLEPQNWNGHDTGNTHSNPESQNWNEHDTGNTHNNPEPQNWNGHDTSNTHSNPEPQNWNGYDTGNTHSNPEPQNWNGHDTSNTHSNLEPQNWDEHSTKTSHSNTNPHQNWQHHSTKIDARNPKPQHQFWSTQGSESGDRSPHPQQHWQRHSLNNDHESPPPHHTTLTHDNIHHNPHHNQHHQHHSHHHHNWTHTNDGYNIRNYHTNDPQRSTNYHNDPPENLMPSEPSPWNWKPPETSSWQQNIVDRLSQHLPKLPSLPKIQIPGLSSLPSFSFPNWVFGERIHQAQDQAYPGVSTGNYRHKFYPLIPKNDPLEHLNSNIDRNHRPLYTYPPLHVHNTHGNGLEHTQSTDTFKHPSHHVNQNSDYTHSHTTPYLTGTTQQYNTNDFNDYTTKNDPLNQQQSYSSYSSLSSGVPQYTRPDPRRPFQKPQRKIKHQEQYQTPPNRQNYRWEVQDTPTPTYPPPTYRDPYSRRPQNWIQDKGIPGRYEDSSTTHKDKPYDQNTYSSHPQQVYEYTPSYGYSQNHHQHQQHQTLNNPWYSETQHQEHNTGFNSDLYDSILEPLSNLISKPSPLSIINSSPYQQSIIERLTGVEPSPTTSIAIPGGLLVLGVALAIFYFNFVWYPTPVVTAKIYKMLSDSVSDGELSEGQQRAVGEVYRVFRGLEAEYKHDPSIWSTSCRTQVVCQVHQELPSLWKVTRTYAALVKSSLAPGPGTDSDLSGYQEAAQRGSEGNDCATLYPDCPLNPTLVKATLRRLLTLLKPT